MKSRTSLFCRVLLLILLFPIIGEICGQNKILNYSLPDSYSKDSLLEQHLPIEEQWWKNFHDYRLDSLIHIAMQNNWNLLMAQQRVIQARASMRSAYGAFFPSLSLSAGWNRGRTSQNMTSTTLSNDPYSSYYSATASMSWEIDVFGNIRENARAQKELYKASRADYAAMMVSIAASIGTAYIELRTTQRLIDVMINNIASQQEVVRITEARYKAGLSSLLDVTQAKSTYYNTKASIAAYETHQSQSINTLALLTGLLPSVIEPVLFEKVDFPKVNRLVPVSIPAGLLRQRPDIRAAEYQVSSQSAALGAARSEWFPTFFVNGEIGVASNKLDRLFEKPSMIWQIAPVMKWTIFNGGQRVAAIASAKAALQSSVDNYNLTVLTALQEVENAISSYKNSFKETMEYRSAP